MTNFILILIYPFTSGIVSVLQVKNSKREAFNDIEILTPQGKYIFESINFEIKIK